MFPCGEVLYYTRVSAMHVMPCTQMPSLSYYGRRCKDRLYSTSTPFVLTSAFRVMNHSTLELYHYGQRRSNATGGAVAVPLVDTKLIFPPICIQHSQGLCRCLHLERLGMQSTTTRQRYTLQIQQSYLAMECQTQETQRRNIKKQAHQTTCKQEIKIRE